MEIQTTKVSNDHTLKTDNEINILNTRNISLSHNTNYNKSNNISDRTPSHDSDLSHFEINTGESITHVNIDSNSHEFSIATLDRKLKKLKLAKKNILPDAPKCEINDMDNILINIHPIRLINDHLKEIQLRIIGHTRAASIYESRNKFFGYPATIISSFTSSSILMSITMDDSNDFNKKTIKYISLAMSITSFFIGVSSNFLEYSKKYQSHDLSSKLYTTLLRSTEVRLISEKKEYTPRALFKEIVDQMSIIEQYEIPIPNSIDQKVRSENIKMCKNTI
jgi:hypothetical protein